MKTLFCKADEESINKAVAILNEGGIVGFPTETVYGIAADCRNGKAVERIFEAKGRPQDNPLICHISDMEMLKDVARNIPEDCYKLADAFWPGPLTMILPKNSLVSPTTCAGLDSVGIRMPSDPVAHRLIEKCGYALAAPSANISGRPSPTNALDVLGDMDGRLPLIIDGGECFAGVESTVVSLLEATPILLRPGYVTAEDISSVLGKDVIIAKAITEGVKQGDVVRSPGMKYKHYAPDAEITILDGEIDDYVKYVENYLLTHSEKEKEKVCCLCFDGEEKALSLPCVSYGIKGDGKSQAKKLFNALRELDKIGADTVFARCPLKNGVSLAVYNRLIRAAAFRLIKL